MNPIIWFAIIGASAIIVIFPNIIWSKNSQKQIGREEHEPFITSEYLARIEQISLEIAENQEPVYQAIILWWGLDGLRLNEDGSMEWISRKKPKPINQKVSYQPCQSIHPIQTGMLLSDHTQSTRVQIDEMIAQTTRLQLQAAQNVQNAAMISQIQAPIMPGYIRYPQMQSPYTSQLTQCCCDWNDLYGRKL